MWTHIIIGIMACVLLAKQVKNKQLDLGFLPQLSLGGLLAVELLKKDTRMGKITSVIVGEMGALNTKFDLPMDAYKLNPTQAAFIVQTMGDERPFLVYQTSAIAIMNSLIVNLNAGGKLDGQLPVKNAEKEEIGIQILIACDEDGQFQSPEYLQWAREKGKFGKYYLD